MVWRIKRCEFWPTWTCSDQNSRFKLLPAPVLLPQPCYEVQNTNWCLNWSGSSWNSKLHVHVHVWICLILHQFLQINAWILPNDDQGTRICNKIQVLCEEFLNLDWEKNWRKKCDLDLECVRMKILLQLGFYMLP